MPNPSEVAELVAGGRSLRDWETVRVKREYGGTFGYFEFSVSEGAPLAKNFAALQIKPGDPVTIMLGGQLAVTGFVNVRQSYYDAHRRAVQIAGRGLTQDVVDSSVNLKGGQLRGYTFAAIARKVCGEHGIGFRMIGQNSESEKPFTDVQIAPGETGYNFLDRLARMRRIVLGDDPQGNLVGMASPSGGGGALVEGQNIKSARCIIRDDYMVGKAAALGQINGNDQAAYKKSSQPTATAINPNGQRNRIAIVLAPRPGTSKEMVPHANMEMAWRISTTVKAEIEVYGWLNGGVLWEAGSIVQVSSPMLMINMSLAIQAVTFSQDNATGTTTLLELVRPEFLGGQTSDLSGGDFATGAVKDAIPDYDYTKRGPG